jgi:molybdopterin-guanine dinucleotide biosynthesis adapter protein
LTRHSTQYKKEGKTALPKLVAIVGAKHSGKTTVIEHLITELKRRGYHVGAIKEMVRIPTLDTPQTETDRYTKAGAEKIVAVPRQQTVIFIKKPLDLKQILPYLEGLDFVLLEGFEHERDIPKIVTAKTFEELKEYLDKSAIAISGRIADFKTEKIKVQSLGVLMISGLTDVQELADLVEKA